jgi:hypothetical protein
MKVQRDGRFDSTFDHDVTRGETKNHSLHINQYPQALLQKADPLQKEGKVEYNMMVLVGDNSNQAKILVQATYIRNPCINPLNLFVEALIIIHGLV